MPQLEEHHDRTPRQTRHAVRPFALAALSLSQRAIKAPLLAEQVGDVPAKLVEHEPTLNVGVGVGVDVDVDVDVRLWLAAPRCKPRRLDRDAVPSRKPAAHLFLIAGLGLVLGGLGQANLDGAAEQRHGLGDCGMGAHTR